MALSIGYRLNRSLFKGTYNLRFNRGNQLGWRQREKGKMMQPDKFGAITS